MQEHTGLRERKKTETRTALSQAVLRLALERGLDAVTAEDIAAAANVSVRTFHNYFGTKEEALVAAWTSEFEVHVEALRAATWTWNSDVQAATSASSLVPK